MVQAESYEPQIETMPGACPKKLELWEVATGIDSQSSLEQLTAHLEKCDACRSLFDHYLKEDLQALRDRTLLLENNLGQTGQTDLHWQNLTEFGTRFRIIEKLGQGGMGEVNKCFDRQLNREVAIKMIRPDLISPSLLNRLLREARIQASLNHQNIVSVYEVGLWDGVPVIAMEFIAGKSLKSILNDHPLSARESARVLAPIARALHYAHSLKVLHRDLKPSNIFLHIPLSSSSLSSSSDFFEPPTPKILDFGLAKQIGTDTDLTQTDNLLGTPAYVAPELVREGSGTWSEASDIYSLGVVLYESLTGHPPFAANSFGMLMAAIENLEPVSPRSLVPGINRDIETICLKCLEKEPARRYPTAAAVAEDLERFLDSRPILARPIGKLQRTRRWCRRNIQVTIAIAVTGFSITSLIIGLIYFAFVQAELRSIAQNNGQLALNQAQQARLAETEARQQRDMARTQFIAGSLVLHDIGNMLAVNKHKPLSESALNEINLAFQRGVLRLSEPYLKRPDLADDSPDLLPKSIFNAARAYQDLGQTSEAIRHYQWLLELIQKSPESNSIAPSSYHFLATNAALSLADLYDSQNQPEKAITLIEPFWGDTEKHPKNRVSNKQKPEDQQLRVVFGRKLQALYLKTSQIRKAEEVKRELNRLPEIFSQKPAS